jgi:hypothetical protein
MKYLFLFKLRRRNNVNNDNYFYLVKHYVSNFRLLLNKKKMYVQIIFIQWITVGIIALYWLMTHREKVRGWDITRFVF